MDIKEFLTVFCSFGSITMESDLKDTIQKINYLLDTCDHIKEREIVRYIYDEGDKSLEKIKKLKQLIWNSCRYMSLFCDTIIRHYIHDAFGLTVEQSLDGLEILTGATVLDPSSIESERIFLSYSLPEGSQPFDIEDYSYAQIRLGEVDTTMCVVDKIFLSINMELFRDEISRISKTGQMILDVINGYLSNEDVRPKSTVERICTRISPILSEFELFTKNLDEYELLRMLSPEENEKESHMRPATMIQSKKKTLALHLLKLLEMDGPDYFRQDDWFKRITIKWGVKHLIHNRLYDFRREGFSQKTYNRIKSLCDVLKNEMQVESLKYEEEYLELTEIVS